MTGSTAPECSAAAASVLDDASLYWSQCCHGNYREPRETEQVRKHKHESGDAVAPRSHLAQVRRVCYKLVCGLLKLLHDGLEGRSCGSGQALQGTKGRPPDFLNRRGETAEQRWNN